MVAVRPRPVAVSPRTTRGSSPRMRGTTQVDPMLVLPVLYAERDRLMARADSGDERAVVLRKAVESAIMDYAGIQSVRSRPTRARPAALHESGGGATGLRVGRSFRPG
jgi:hypothetical protein